MGFWRNITSPKFLWKMLTAHDEDVSDE